MVLCDDLEGCDGQRKAQEVGDICILIADSLWKILKEMGIPDHLICLLRNLYAGQEATLELDMEKQTGSK